MLLVQVIHAEEAPKRRVEFGKSDYVAPPGLVFGSAFIDRLLPIPADKMSSDLWGGDNVLPRNPDNGLEDAQWSYWCMDPVETGDGLVHLFACRWPENSPKGHMTWPNSTIVRAVSESPLGPFRVVQEIGPGHNVMVFRTKAGTWRIYKNQGGAECTKGYRADFLTGIWRPDALVFDTRGMPGENMWNLSFVERADGSVLMVSLKQDDLGSDKHNSKIIAVPIALQRRLALQPAAEGEFAVLLKAEQGFNPAADLDPAALRFGAPPVVDFGRGAAPFRTEIVDSDLRLVFASKDLGFLPSDYCGKLLGKDKSGGARSRLCPSPR